MSRILVVGFTFCNEFYYSIILCKAKTNSTEYRITVMDGDIEKQLCTNNILEEIDGCLQFELSGNVVQDQIKTEVARALGKIIEKPVREVKMPKRGNL